MSWLSGSGHQTQVLVVKLLWMSVGSNPSHDTCVLQQDAKKRIKCKRGESHWVFLQSGLEIGLKFWWLCHLV